MKTILIVIDDTPPAQNDPLLIRSAEVYDDIEIFSSQPDALQFIRQNLHHYLVVLLDYKFPDSEKTGTGVLSDIRDISELIPVIIWTANVGGINDFPSLIGDQAFAICSKGDDYEKTVEVLLQAATKVRHSLLEALEEYIERFPDDEKDRITFKQLGGRSFSLRELFREISQRTDIGIETERKLFKLTIKKLLNGER